MDFSEFLKNSGPLPKAAAVPLPTTGALIAGPSVPARRVAPTLAEAKKMAGSGTKSTEELIADIQKLMDAFGGEQGTEEIEKPVFDLGSIAPEKLPLPEMPVDIRPIAAMMDNIYGSKTYDKTPNLPAETLAQAKALQSLNQGSNALLQTQAQAKLSEFNKQLEEYYNRQGQQSPLQIAQTIKAYRQALGGGDDEAGNLAKLISLKIMDNQNENAFNQNKLAAEKEVRERTNDLSQKLFQHPSITNYNKVANAGKRVRAAIYNPRFTGIGDYGVVIDFIKGLDPASTVMFSEAQALEKAQGIQSQLKNYLPRLSDASQGVLSEPAKKDIGNLLNEYQRISKAEADRTVQFYRDSATQQSLPPDAVVGGVVKSIDIPNDKFVFTNFDKNGKPVLNSKGKPQTFEVQDNEVEMFKTKYPYARPAAKK